MTTTMIKPEDVKRLREQTGAGVMDCKRALEDSGGDLEKATHWLREKGLSAAAKKADREVREGVIGSYIHHGARLGSMVELNCETDFVARTDEFKNLARDVAIAVAGHDTVLYVSRDDVPPEVLDSQRKAFAAEARDEGKPAHRVAEIAEGKLNKWLEAACLMELQYRDTDRKISDLIIEKIALLKENIRVARFVRMAVGDAGSGHPGSGPEAA
jgi:elongation factor Ts